MPGKIKMPGPPAPLLRGLLGLITLIASPAPLPSQEADMLTLKGSTMGTTYTIHLVGTIHDLGLLHQQVDHQLEVVNDQMSTWREDSEISRFNRHRDSTWFPVSLDTATVVAEALRIAELTGGAFDVTIGPLVNLWQFGPEQREGPPDEEQLNRTLAAVGYKLLEVRLDPPALRKQHPDCYVDLSGIAKGFGVDQVARLLDRQEIEAYLVEIGGEVRTRGEKKPGTPWTLGIEAPVSGRRELQRTLKLTDQSLATSGDYRNFRDLDGRRISHTINPWTGRPVQHNLASVTVVTPSCMEADALATALLVLGPEKAYDWLVTHDVAALLIARGEDGSFSERLSPRFTRTLVSEPIPPGARTAQGSSMMVYLFALLVFVIAVAAMAVGVMFGRRGLRGTCGGLANLKDERGRSMCDACHDPSPDCGGIEEGKRRDAAKSGVE